MPFFENGRGLQFQNSTLTDVGRDNHIHYGTKQTALSILKNYMAAGAFHNSSERFDPPKCHPETRIAVLNKIRDWYKNKDPAAPRIMWLYGPAGAGKSAIAQTIAEECHKLRALAASFFFSRIAPGRNDANRLIATIAYQIAQDIPDTRSHIQQALENDPMIFSKSLETQLHQLVTKPLLDMASDHSINAEFWPKLIIIDGLDECNGGEVQQAIIYSFASAVTQCALPLCVLILSRPEQPIRESFSHSDRRGNYVSLVLDDDYKPARDIELFLRESFTLIRETHVLKSHIPKTWPSKKDIHALVRKSSGQFIFASTVIRYTKSPRHRPMDRLQNVLGIGSHEDAAPFAELDALYMHILQSADQAQHATILRIFGVLLCTDKPYIREPSEIEDFLNLSPGDVYLALADCHSIVNLPPEDTPSPHSTVHFLHASITDFLIDPARSQRFFVEQKTTHAELVRACIRGVSSTQQAVRLYSSLSLPRHSQNTHMDKTLLEDLLCVNLSDLFEIYAHERIQSSPSYYQYSACFKQISWVIKQVYGGLFNVSKGSLDRHIATLDRCLSEQLLTFTWPNRFPEIHALADMIQSTLSLQSREDAKSRLRVPDAWIHVGLLPNLEIARAYKPVLNTTHFNLSTSFMYEDTVSMENPYLDSPIAPRRSKRICGKPHEDFARTRNIYDLGDQDYEAGDEDQESEACQNPRTCKLGIAAIPSSAGSMRVLADSLRSGESTGWAEIGVARKEKFERYDSLEKRRSQSDQEAEENLRAAKRPRRLIESPNKRGLAEKSARDEGQQEKAITRRGASARVRRGKASGTSGGTELLRRSARRRAQKI